MVTQLSLQQTFDQEVIAGCIAGKKQYQKILYDHFSPKMKGICLRYASDRHSAEDILQEGFIKAFKHLHLFRKEGSFEGWLKKIFITTAIEYYRKNLRFNRLLDIESASEVTVDTQILQGLYRKDLLALIQKLPIGYRTIFNMYAIEGYNHREISELLNISEGTSKSQLSRARATLKEMIHHYHQ